MDYKIPGSLDVPYEINPIIVEHPEPDGPYGAKGVGEIPLLQSRQLFLTQYKMHLVRASGHYL